MGRIDDGRGEMLSEGLLGGDWDSPVSAALGAVVGVAGATIATIRRWLHRRGS